MTPAPFIRHSANLLAACFLLLASPSFADHNPPPPPSPADIDAQYAATLAAMKQPLASGVLVTEVGPGSPAGSAGLRAGDIIVKLHGNDVRNLAALRQQVADLFASNLVSEKESNVILTVRRVGSANKNATAPAIETILLQVPREPLGIRAIEVEAGVAAALNPPISPRGAITMAWDDLRKLQNAPGGGSDLGQQAFLRNTQGDERTGTAEWLGWQKRTADPATDDAITGTVDQYRIALDDKSADVIHAESVSFQLRTGDYRSAPAFLLESADVTTHPGDSTVVKISAQRAGPNFRTATETTFRERIIGPVNAQRETPLNAIIPAAVPLVAAAMPQEKDAAIPVYLMSVRDFVARPGYVLVARGKQNLPDAKPESPDQAWRVDLLHCGVIIESYWLSDHRKLLRIDSLTGTPVTSRRVPTELEARASAEQKPRPK